MRIFGYKLSSWLRHPFLVYEAMQNRKLPFIDLDHPVRNCVKCQHVHDTCKCGCHDMQINIQGIRNAERKRCLEFFDIEMEAWMSAHEKKQRSFQTKDFLAHMRKNLSKDIAPV